MKEIPLKYRFVYGWFQLVDKIVGRSFGKKITKRSRKTFYTRLHNHLKRSGLGKLYDVESVSNITIQEFKRNYLRKGKPVVMRGLAKEWGCVKDWSIDYFRDLHGEDEVTIVGNDSREKLFEILKLSEVLDDIQSGGSKYFRFYPLLTEHPEHLSDFDQKWLREAKHKGGWWERFQVFIGGKGTHTSMHNAIANNLFVQAYGQKEWILYPPSYSAIIDPAPGFNFHRHAPFKKKEGPFNPFAPDYETPYHLFQYIDGIMVTLNPGDVFYNPPHYWHTVQNPTDSIGIGYRWGSLLASFKVAPWYTFLDVINAPFNKELYSVNKKNYNTIHMKELGIYEAFLKEKEKLKNRKINQ